MHRSCWGLVPLVAAVSGCGLFGGDADEKPVAAQTVAERTETIVVSSLTNSLGSLRALAEIETIGELGSDFEHMQSMLDGLDVDWEDDPGAEGGWF